MDVSQKHCLHEKTQLGENAHCMTPLLGPSDKGKQHRSAVRRERAGGGLSIKGTETLGSDGNVLLLDCRGIYTSCYLCIFRTQVYIQKG